MTNKNAVALTVAGLAWFWWYNSRKPKLSWQPNLMLPGSADFVLTAYGYKWSGNAYVQTPEAVYPAGNYLLKIHGNGSDEIHFALYNGAKLIWEYSIVSMA